MENLFIDCGVNDRFRDEMEILRRYLDFDMGVD